MKELNTFRKYLAEGRLFENSILNDEISTSKELLDFVVGGEGEKILDDITNIGNNPVLDGKKLWNNSVAFKHGDEEEAIEDFWFDGGSRTRSKNLILFRLLSNTLERNVFENFISRENIIKIIEKAKNKYGIELLNINNYSKVFKK
jgi:hypothetical protein|tara:strand:+ start:369 stop:806 length:438 start_codon:yes stop_codon:yes gene_type:complete